MIKSRKIRWAWHIAHKGEKMHAYVHGFGGKTRKKETARKS
jgi:hypothetical protein